jgi:hypothetical protein
MQHFILVCGMFLAVCGLAVAETVGPFAGMLKDDKASTARAPVLVELFTSEGCSSCPPADLLLSRLMQESPIEGVPIVALGFHVDYWDRLGWKDRFSSAAFTERQNQYAAAWKTDRIYTPQAVVDGRFEFVGTDVRKVVSAIAESGARPHATVSVRVDPSGLVAAPTLALTVMPPPGVSMSGEIWLAIAEDGLASDVKAGENANRRLEHAGVVRRLDRIGKLTSGLAFSLDDYTLKRDPSWKSGALRAVVIVQDPKTRAIKGVGEARF